MLPISIVSNWDRMHQILCFWALSDMIVTFWSRPQIVATQHFNEAHETTVLSQNSAHASKSFDKYPLEQISSQWGAAASGISTEWAACRRCGAPCLGQKPFRLLAEESCSSRKSVRLSQSPSLDWPHLWVRLSSYARVNQNLVLLLKFSWTWRQGSISGYWS